MNKHPNNRRYKEMLPPWEEFSNSELCKGASSNVKCFLAGQSLPWQLSRMNNLLAIFKLHLVHISVCVLLSLLKSQHNHEVYGFNVRTFF